MNTDYRDQLQLVIRLYLIRKLGTTIKSFNKHDQLYPYIKADIRELIFED